MFNYGELLEEIKKVKEEIKSTRNWKHKNDLEKYLNRLYKMKNDYEKYMNMKGA